jgi:hypothetical protein
MLAHYRNSLRQPATTRLASYIYTLALFYILPSLNNQLLRKMAAVTAIGVPVKLLHEGEGAKRV